ncbi:hypothetical protein [Gimibacter soli]|uniref:PAS domain-containing protein n=1 Tax=Gimibacter soli TaxID=3024400 RepID=A0AAF0BM99_9PROT|nr:hypothetical protein [Gimibacter soli]WCL54270.1 hypothetical protein PH603_00665 [Gimibacter soli]
MSAPSSARQFSPFEPVELVSEGAPLQPAYDLHPQARFVLDQVLGRVTRFVDGVVPRSAIHPQDFAVALPNIAMIDIRFEDDGEFAANATIVGEELSSRYGLKRGLLSLQAINADADRRFRDVIQFIRRVRRPVAVRVPRILPGRPHYEARGLYVPYSREADVICGVLLHAVVITNHH